MNEKPFQIGDAVSFQIHGRILPQFLLPTFAMNQRLYGEVRAIGPNHIGVEVRGVLFWKPANELTLDASLEEKAEFFQSIYED